jgi:hypothetical protein
MLNKQMPVVIEYGDVSIMLTELSAMFIIARVRPFSTNVEISPSNLESNIEKTLLLVMSYVVLFDVQFNTFI